LFKNGSHILFY